MRSTSQTRSKNFTKSNGIGQVASTLLESLLTLTELAEPFEFPCQDTFRTCSRTITWRISRERTHQASTHPLYILRQETPPRTQQMCMINLKCRSYPLNASNTFNRLLASASITHELLTQPLSVRYPRLPLSRLTQQRRSHLVQCLSRWPNSGLLIQPSDMLLKAHTDASYLSETKARSRLGAFLYLGKYNDDKFINAAIQHSSPGCCCIISCRG